MLTLAGARRSFAKSTDGGEIAYWEAGRPDGPTVVFLHGFALDHTIWWAQFSDPVLTESCRLIAPDLRGHGQSVRPVDEAGYRNGELWAADLHAVLDASNAIDPVVVAWSFGGRMANDYLRYYGTSRLAGLCYVAAATLSNVSTVGPAHECLAGLCALDLKEEEKAVTTFISCLLKFEPGSPSYQRAVQILSLTAPAQRAMMRRRPLDYDDLFEQLDIPVLLVHGLNDPAVLPLLSTRLKDLIPDAQLSLYSNAGHAPFLQEPHRFNAELASFVKHCQSPTRVA